MSSTLTEIFLKRAQNKAPFKRNGINPGSTMTGKHHNLAPTAMYSYARIILLTVHNIPRMACSILLSAIVDIRTWSCLVIILAMWKVRRHAWTFLIKDQDANQHITRTTFTIIVLC